jgi:hyperosmotically inducible periplasmic protein
MKKLLFLLLTGSILSMQACKPKDADIKVAVDSAIGAIGGVSATVSEGVVTLSGTVASEAVKTEAETAAKAVKGVKSVSNEISVVVPVISGDVALNEAIKTAMAAFTTVQAVAKDSIITLTGEIVRADLQKVIQAAQSLRPKKVENQLTIK